MARYYQDVVEELSVYSEKLDKLWLNEGGPAWCHDAAAVCSDASHQITEMRKQIADLESRALAAEGREHRLAADLKEANRLKDGVMQELIYVKEHWTPKKESK